MKKIIVLILLIVPLSLFKPAMAYAAVTLSLSPVSKTVAVGESFEASLILDTGVQSISGGSAVLTYDPTKLQVVDSNANVVGIQVTAGSIFTTPTSNSADAVNGKITLDYGTSVGSFSGNGVFGKITFKALAATTTSSPVSFILGTAGSAGSAIYSAGTNVLAAANSGSYTISTTVATPTPTLVTTSTTSALPETGAVENTIFILALGSIFLFGGVFAFAKARS